MPDDDLAASYGAADVFAMLCRNRWLGLEQEGFGIVFLEAAAAGVPQLAGASGGAAEAVVDGVTGTVVRDPRSGRRPPSASAGCSTTPSCRARTGRRGPGRAEADLLVGPAGWPRCADALARWAA